MAFKFNPDFKPQRVNVADVFTFSGAKDDAEKEGKEIGGNVANGGAKGVEENKARATGAVQGMVDDTIDACLLYTSPSPRDGLLFRMTSSA